MKTKKREIYLLVQNDFVPSNKLEQTIFYEAYKVGKIQYMQEPSHRGILNLLTKRKIQNLSGDLFNGLWMNICCLPNKLEKLYVEYENIYVIFLNTTFTKGRYSIAFLKKLKKRYPKIKYILYYLDTVVKGESEYANYARELNLFDIVYTFDLEDANTYGLRYWSTPYSKLDVKNIENEIEDIYFCGVDSDRREILNKIISNKNITMEMDIVEVEDKKTVDLINRKNIKIYNQEEILPYEITISHMLNSKCILELVRPNQVGLTLRPYEAVVYGKKLITNNKTILSFPYYNKDYMQYFEKVEDIDWEWINNEKKIDYKYDGRFSPLKLLEDIKLQCKNN